MPADPSPGDIMTDQTTSEQRETAVREVTSAVLGLRPALSVDEVDRYERIMGQTIGEMTSIVKRFKRLADRAVRGDINAFITLRDAAESEE